MLIIFYTSRLILLIIQHSISHNYFMFLNKLVRTKKIHMRSLSTILVLRQGWHWQLLVVQQSNAKKRSEGCFINMLAAFMLPYFAKWYMWRRPARYLPEVTTCFHILLSWDKQRAITLRVCPLALVLNVTFHSGNLCFHSSKLV